MQEEAVRQRLDSLIRTSGVGYAALSRKIGRNAAYLQQFIRRGVPRRLAEADRHILACHFGVSEHLLGAPAVSADAGSSPPTLQPQASQAGRFILVPYLADGKDGGESSEALAFDPALALPMALPMAHPLPAITHCDTPSARLAAWRVRGDGMAPTLNDGDTVLIQSHEPASIGDGLYAIRSQTGVQVRRVSFHPVSGRLSIISDNAAYPACHDCDPESIALIGRIIWVGRRIA